MKTCSFEGCNAPVWSKGLCRRHTPSKGLKRGLKKNPEKKQQTEALHAKMKQWWRTRPKVCEACGAKLPPWFSTANVHHLLSKSKYKEVMMEEKYWMLLCFDCHSAWEQCPVNEKIKQRTLEAEKHYMEDT